MIVALDGPAGAGKSTLAKRLSERLGFRLLDTGALYRSVGLAAIRAGVDLDDHAALGALAAGLPIQFVPDGAVNRVELGGEDVTTAIRTAEVSAIASRVSAVPAVRKELLELQRALGRSGDAVMEGRDIGTVVFPDAEVKVFVTASLAERAQRRMAEYDARGQTVDIAEVEAEIAERDRRDEERETAPMRAADDAVVLDTSGRSIDELLETLVAMVEAARQP